MKSFTTVTLDERSNPPQKVDVTGRGNSGLAEHAQEGKLPRVKREEQTTPTKGRGKEIDYQIQSKRKVNLGVAPGLP